MVLQKGCDLMQFTAILLAGGNGKRTGLKTNKVFLEIKGKKVLDYSLELLKKQAEISEIILVLAENVDNSIISHYKELVDHIVFGGLERQDSVFNALNKAKNDYILIHDGARPFIPESSLREIYKNINVEKSMTLGVKLKDTVFKMAGNHVVETFDRNDMISVQTPQAFHKEALLKAHELARKEMFYGTDDTMLMAKYLGINAYVIQGDYRNIKLTTIEDISLLEVIL